MVSFFKSFAKKKAGSVLDDIQAALIKADLSTATAAQLDMYDEQIAGLARKVADANADYQREQGEADAIKADYNRKVDAAQRLRTQAAAEADPARKDGLQKSLATFVAEIEAMQADVKREIDEAAQAKDIYDTYKASLDTIRDKLATARQALKANAARIEKARMDEERSKDLLSAKQAAAGLTRSSSGLDTVMTTMSKIADDAEARAAANRLHADALTPQTKPVDSNIQAALDAVDGKAAAPADLGGRLDSLQKF